MQSCLKHNDFFINTHNRHPISHLLARYRVSFVSSNNTDDLWWGVFFKWYQVLSLQLLSCSLNQLMIEQGIKWAEHIQDLLKYFVTIWQVTHWQHRHNVHQLTPTYTGGSGWEIGYNCKCVGMVARQYVAGQVAAWGSSNTHPPWKIIIMHHNNIDTWYHLHTSWPSPRSWLHSDGLVQ